MISARLAEHGLAIGLAAILVFAGVDKTEVAKLIHSASQIFLQGAAVDNFVDFGVTGLGDTSVVGEGGGIQIATGDAGDAALVGGEVRGRLIDRSGRGVRGKLGIGRKLRIRGELGVGRGRSESLGSRIGGKLVRPSIESIVVIFTGNRGRNACPLWSAS